MRRLRGIDAVKRPLSGDCSIVARQTFADHGPDHVESAHALWIEARAQPRLRRSVAPAPGPGDCRVRSLFGAISRGTERLVFEGLVPESEHERMRAPLQEGAFPFPVKYGYSAVGRVEAVRSRFAAGSSSACTRIRTSSPLPSKRCASFP